MKESALFLAFLKRNFFIVFLPVLTGLLISIFVYSSQPPKTKISQAFKLEYNLDNIDTAAALADQAVAQMRIQEFDKLFPDSKASIYKSGPFLVSVEILSKEKETGFELLIKETEYLRQNFIVSAINQPVIKTIDPSFLKYILTGSLIGFLVGLIISLYKEYIRNY